MAKSPNRTNRLLQRQFHPGNQRPLVDDPQAVHRTLRCSDAAAVVRQRCDVLRAGRPRTGPRGKVGRVHHLVGGEDAQRLLQVEGVAFAALVLGVGAAAARAGMGELGGDQRRREVQGSLMLGGGVGRGFAVAAAAYIEGVEEDGALFEVALEGSGVVVCVGDGAVVVVDDKSLFFSPSGVQLDNGLFKLKDEQRACLRLWKCLEYIRLKGRHSILKYGVLVCVHFNTGSQSNG